MDVPVTVDARRAGHHIYPYLCPPPNRVILVVEGNVAFPAQPDWRFFQQVRKGAAVGLMAIEAILHDGRVLKKERTPVLGMTIEAEFFNGNSLYEEWRNRPVRVVATRAVHFPLPHGMMRKPVLCANLLFMTGSTRIRYGYTGELITGHYSGSRMDRMAGGASEVVDVVNTVGPEKPVPLLMALETDIVAPGDGVWRPLGKANHTLE